MKGAVKPLSLDTSKIHAPEFDCVIDSGSDNPTTTDQDESTGPDAAYKPGFESSQYQLSSLLSYRPPPEGIHPHFIWTFTSMPKETDTMVGKIKDTFEQPGLDW